MALPTLPAARSLSPSLPPVFVPHTSSLCLEHVRPTPASGFGVRFSPACYTPSPPHTSFPIGTYYFYKAAALEQSHWIILNIFSILNV